MKQRLTVGMMIAGAAFAVALWSGTAQAAEQFQAVNGIPVERISQTEMAAVEGKLFEPGSFRLDIGGLTESGSILKFLLGTNNPGNALGAVGKLLSGDGGLLGLGLGI